MIIYRCNQCQSDQARHCLTDLVVTLRAAPQLQLRETRTAQAELHLCDTCLKRYGLNAFDLRSLSQHDADNLVQQAALKILADTAQQLRRQIEALLRRQLDHADVPHD